MPTIPTTTTTRLANFARRNIAYIVGALTAIAIYTIVLPLVYLILPEDNKLRLNSLNLFSNRNEERVSDILPAYTNNTPIAEVDYEFY